MAEGSDWLRRHLSANFESTGSDNAELRKGNTVEVRAK